MADNVNFALLDDHQISCFVLFPLLFLPFIIIFLPLSVYSFLYPHSLFQLLRKITRGKSLPLHNLFVSLHTNKQTY